ncbi:uncharacterized protein JN550_004560 [Neoarthrinium moseri]|uniref:uncharacterized protein n=1 Tax=Neoarthrinium moseri TaxID=1658444 RepID=UPI001FDCDE9B|nr:uncharacterized protein JN550_004560 [Neoarthrinium moseri]KAI1871566.1 hypothetical protein JN550_004560 [Neoarthrinium moseri]
MPFSALPPEIVHEILTAAVKVRDIQRATRLRHVSRSWAAAVPEAIFASGILDSDPRSMSSHSLYYKPRYLAYRVLSRAQSLSRPLRIVRKVAEYLVAHRNLDTCYEDAIRDCVHDLCRIPHIGINHNCSRQEEDWLTGPSAESIDENDMQFQQALLSAAAWANELALIRRTLPLFQNCLYLISHDGWGGEYSFE